MPRILVFEESRKRSEEIRNALIAKYPEYVVTVARKIDTALDRLLRGDPCGYSLLVSQSALLVNKLMSNRSGRFDTLSAVKNAGPTRKGGTQALMEEVSSVMAFRNGQ